MIFENNFWKTKLEVINSEFCVLFLFAHILIKFIIQLLYFLYTFLIEISLTLHHINGHIFTEADTLIYCILLCTGDGTERMTKWS